MVAPFSRIKKNIDVIINSANRDFLNSVSSTDFRINISNPPSSKILFCGLKSVTFPNGIYNINDSTFEITDSSGLNNVSIVAGNYSLTQLLTYLQNQLNALGVDTYVVTYTDRVNISSDFIGFVLNPNNSINTFLSNLGFLNQSYSAPVTADNLPDISGIKNLYIKIDQISSYIRNSLDIKYNFKFDVNCGFGKIVFFANENKYLQEYNVESDDLISNSYFDVKLVDEYGAVVNNNGLDWNFTLSLVTQNLNQP